MTTSTRTPRIINSWDDLTPSEQKLIVESKEALPKIAETFNSLGGSRLVFTQLQTRFPQEVQQLPELQSLIRLCQRSGILKNIAVARKHGYSASSLVEVDLSIVGPVRERKRKSIQATGTDSAE